MKASSNSFVEWCRPKCFALLAIVVPPLPCALGIFFALVGPKDQVFSFLVTAAAMPPVVALVLTVISAVRKEHAMRIALLGVLLSFVPAALFVYVLSNLKFSF